MFVSIHGLAPHYLSIDAIMHVDIYRASTDLNSRRSANPNVSADPVCIFLNKNNTDCDWITWADPNYVFVNSSAKLIV